MNRVRIILLSLSLFSIFSCSKNRGVISDNVAIISAHDVEGKWLITQYADSGVDKTEVFASITLQFNSGGSLSVSRNDSIFSGNWLIQENVGLDKLNIVVSTVSMPYGMLQENWFVKAKSNTSLSLYHAIANGIATLELERL